jgi:hypothetical protein
MRFASKSLPWMRQVTIRSVTVETATVQVKAAIDASLPRRCRSPTRKQHG